jgi:hypothetical protein
MMGATAILPLDDRVELNEWVETISPVFEAANDLYGGIGAVSGATLGAVSTGDDGAVSGATHNSRLYSGFRGWAADGAALDGIVNGQGWSDHALNKKRWRNLARVSRSATSRPAADAVDLWGLWKRNSLENKVLKFLGHRVDWDGEEADPIPEAAVFQALNYIDMAEGAFMSSIPTGVAPSPDGEIVIFWSTQQAYIELNFDGSNQCVVCYRFDQNEMQSHTDICDVELSNSTKSILERISDTASI